jgi:hypothetical protein
MSNLENEPNHSVAEAPLSEIPLPATVTCSSAHVQFGRTFPPQQQILLYSAGDWEGFIHEWVHSLRTQYKSVRRFSGAGDMGIDIAGFKPNGDWVNYQCKHYSTAITPSIAAEEIGKLLWHTFMKHYSSPSKYYFIAPRGCGISLTNTFRNIP